MPLRALLPLVFVLVAIGVTGCTAGSAPTAEQSSTVAPSASLGDESTEEEPDAVAFSACSAETTAALAAQPGAEAAVDLQDLSGLVPVPSCVILQSGSSLGYYLNSSQSDFDSLMTTLSAAGFEVVPKDLEQSVKDKYGYLAYFDFRQDGVGQGSVTYISAAPSLGIAGPFMLLGWFSLS